MDPPIHVLDGDVAGHSLQRIEDDLALEREPQASFAMTDGLDVEMWLIPEGGGNVMTLLEGEGLYEVSLVRGSSGDYDLRLKVNLRPAEGDGEPTWVVFESEKTLWYVESLFGKSTMVPTDTASTWGRKVSFRWSMRARWDSRVSKAPRGALSR